MKNSAHILTNQMVLYLLQVIKAVRTAFTFNITVYFYTCTKKSGFYIIICWYFFLTMRTCFPYKPLTYYNSKWWRNCEIRDNETAEAAIQASLTGHLVLSTLHTNDSPTAIARLIEMEVEPFLISSSLAVVYEERLSLH